MTISWFSLDPVNTAPGDKFFTVRARATRSGNLQYSLNISSDITESELYDASETIYEPILLIQSNDGGDFFLPLTPNPATDVVTVPFYLAEAGRTTIQFRSIDNKFVFSEAVIGQAGRNELTVPVGELAGGMLICMLQSEHGVSTQKLMIIK